MGALPDVERIVSTALRADPDLDALLAGRIYGELPKTSRTFPLCRLGRIGGGPAGTPLYLDAAVLQFDVWGGTKYETRTIAATIVAVLDTLAGYTAHGGYITGVDPGATRYIPDETYTPARPRYVVESTVYIRPTS